MNKEAQQRIEKAKAEKLCLGCMKPLDETRTVRGLHERCYRSTMRHIDRGIWTESERIGEGKLLDDDKGGRPVSNPISIEAAQSSSE